MYGTIFVEITRNPERNMHTLGSLTRDEIKTDSQDLTVIIS